jgi:hypothetical protein
VTPGEAIEAAELIELETRYRRQIGREMYAAGRRDAEAEMAERWNRIAGPVSRARDHGGIEEIEARRWGPGGREAFGQPRPGDFPGLTVHASNLDSQPELELEAGT